MAAPPAHRRTRRFVGSADIQSLADLGNSYEVVRTMRIAPITNLAILGVVAATLLPIAPLVLTVMPLEELLKKRCLPSCSKKMPMNSNQPCVPGRASGTPRTTVQNEIHNSTHQRTSSSNEGQPTENAYDNPHLKRHLPMPRTGLLALTCALTAHGLGPNESGLRPSLTLAPVEAASSGGGGAAEDAKAQAAELAKKLQNPIASLISVPIQNNFDWGAGPDGDGFQYKVNVQPVIPLTLSEDWNLITRTILPIVYQEDIVGTSSQSGLADTLESFFFSPVQTGQGGWIWGAGPVFLLPTATDDLLGAEKWGAGPTAVVLKQQKGWTYGALAKPHLVLRRRKRSCGCQRHLPAAVRLPTPRRLSPASH